MEERILRGLPLPKDPGERWEVLLLLLSSEEKKFDRTRESEIDTMMYFASNEGIKKLIEGWLDDMLAEYARKKSEEDTAFKCDEVSLLWRLRGNNNFRVNRIEDSYACYSKSVLYAAQDGPMYPLALANRSAALLRMRKYKECLADASLAIDCNYPNAQRHKLMIRQCDCYIQLGLRKDAEAKLKEAKEHVSNLNLLPDHTSEAERHIAILEKKLETMKDKPAEKPDMLPLLYKGDNPEFCNASSALGLRRRENVGRYVLARETLHRGDILFSEEPYAWITLPGETLVCEACCRANINPIPCRICSRSVYCGTECRTRGNEVHRWECKGAQANIFNTIGIAHLSLRVLLVSTAQGFPKVSHPHRPPRTAAELFACYSSVDAVDIYHKDTHPFFRMFKLVTNFEKMDNPDYVMYALSAMMLCTYLDKFTGFFDYLPTRMPYQLPRDELRYFASGLLLRGIGQLICNGHAIISLETIPDSVHTVTEHEVRRATAIYPSAAMMNHSCDPNIVNTFYNTRLIIRCALETTAGSEIVNCYGMNRARKPTPLRRAFLRSQYMFTCSCPSCIDPEQKDFALLFNAYACQQCKGPVMPSEENVTVVCKQCRCGFHVGNAVKVIEEAEVMIKHAEQASSLAQRCERMAYALRMKQSVLYRHHHGIRCTADKLARLYAEDGQFNRSVELIKQNIQTIEYQYGSFSAEVAHELRKLSGVMIMRITGQPQNHGYRDWCLETHKIIKKAIQVTEFNFGSWEPLLKDLREKEERVRQELAAAPEDPMDWVHNKLHYNLKI